MNSADGAASAPRPDGLVEVHTTSFSSPFDGRRVPAIVAIPRAAASRGCVIAQQASKKESASTAWQTLAWLGLTTFAIDFRDQGAVNDPAATAERIRGTVADLRSAVDYLENQPFCRHNVAYAGVRFAGIVGTLLAADDRRVKAAVLISTPGTFRGALTTRGNSILPGIASDRTQLAAAVRTLSPLDPARFVGRISPRPVLILSGLDDKTISKANARRLQAAARRPKTIVEYRGGHDPTSGPAASSNGQAITSFLLRNLVEPTYGISGNPNGTFTQR